MYFAFTLNGLTTGHRTAVLRGGKSAQHKYILDLHNLALNSFAALQFCACINHLTAQQLDIVPLTVWGSSSAQLNHFNTHRFRFGSLAIGAAIVLTQQKRSGLHATVTATLFAFGFAQRPCRHASYARFFQNFLPFFFFFPAPQGPQPQHHG
jgi:hypothetical protein